MIKKKYEIEIDDKEISMVKNLGIGIGCIGKTDNEVFIMTFNRDEEGFEKLFCIPPDKLQEIIILLFQAGVTFQTETGIDIGFDVRGKINENSDEE